MYLLDTSTLIDLLHDRPQVLSRFAEVPPGTGVYTSIISQGELMVGVFSLIDSPRRPASPDGLPSEIVELGKVNQLLGRLTDVLPVTKDTTATYVFLQWQLMRRGKRRLAVNDGWIAATASDHELTLVTSDDRFRDLDFALRIEDWRA